MFIVVSGFCLLLPVIPRAAAIPGSPREPMETVAGVGLFLRRRAHRLLPPYYLSMVVCPIIGATVNTFTGTLWDGWSIGTLRTSRSGWLSYTS